MELTEIRGKRKAAELLVEEVLENFEKETGLTVQGVDLVQFNTQDFGGDEGFFRQGVKFKIEL